ncbi:MAG: glycoside hydrolase family 2 TIM barrel-domain containing protein [Pirellulales bacterium]
MSFAQSVQVDQWEVSIDSGKTFKKVPVPSTIENTIDVAFDGVSIYRTRLPSLKVGQGQRVILNFAAVATRAKVFVNQKLLAEHLGGWTPFAVDVTEAVQEAGDSSKVEVHVEVDELVGHNTQGFLPVVTNHFSGIWQPVSVEVVKSTYILKKWFSVQFDQADQLLLIKLPISGDLGNAENSSLPTDETRIERYFEFSEFHGDGRRDWQPIKQIVGRVPKAEELQTELLAVGRSQLAMFIGSLKVSELKLKNWSPESPQLYCLRCTLYQHGRQIDQAETTFGVRDFATQDDQFRLNGHAISIRGVLNWGYSPPSLAPSLDRQEMRKEIQFAKDRGFNLMKYCLYVPPQEYLDLGDQMGMLAWIEYPTWHPKLDGQHLQELRREYAEFFAYDRGHPSVVLRSLTCETGSSAQLSVIQSLYDQCKQMIPGAVVEDDSSWISWNRVHDFYDDHPYGNNHTWRKTLADLRGYMSTRTTKPLALGEAIAADNWIAPSLENIQAAKADLAHGSWSIEDNDRWIQQMDKLAKRNGRIFQPERMCEQSLHYGWLMRKFQIEAFHQEMPNSGYVVSVIRDFPKASMGLIDGKNNPKIDAVHWQFQSDQMLLLKTENDRRSFWGGKNEKVELIAKQLPVQTKQSNLSLELRDEEGRVQFNQSTQTETNGILTTIPVAVPLPKVAQPKRFTISATWTGIGDTKTDQKSSTTIARNDWPIWIFPASQPYSGFAWNIQESARELFDANELQPQISAASSNRVLLTRVLDEAVIAMLEKGGRVLMVPSGQPGSFPSQSHWFLRGSVVALPKSNERWDLPFDCQLNGKASDQNMLVELQHFDLAGNVVPHMEHYLEYIDPMVVLWDNHDMRETRTHGLAFQCRVGKGQLLVTTLNHAGPTNAAGRWLLQQWVALLQRNLLPPQQADFDMLERLKAELNRKQFSLAKQTWKFKPDPEKVGEAANWKAADFDDSDWGKIGIDRHWEGQGHPSLDNWAWYRTKADLPKDWKSGNLYLNVNGIDDYADIYVNGQKVASVGDIENKKTAFEVRDSFDISKLVSGDRTFTIAIAVYDWFGAGGIFRPITLSTEPTATQRPMLIESLQAK